MFFRKVCASISVCLWMICIVPFAQSQILIPNAVHTILNGSFGDSLVPQLSINLPLSPLTPLSTEPTPITPLQNRNPAAPPTFKSTVKAPVTFGTRFDSDSYRRIGIGAQQFGLRLLSKISDIEFALHSSNPQAPRVDFMISPFAIWSLLLLLAEGSSGNTLQQLRNALYIDEDPATLRKAFRDVQAYLKINTSTVEVASLQALFTDKNQPVSREYENIISRDYGSELISVDFQDVNATYQFINTEVRSLTRGLIQYTVQPQDLKDAHLLLLSSLYFKGQWTHPFNKTLTRSEPFYDERGNAIGNVQMMVQEANFNYVGINELGAHVLELPYGKEDRLSMLILLPRRGIYLNNVVHNLEKYGIPAIFSKLSTSVGYEDEHVEVFLPKFSTFSDLVLESTLQELGIVDLFEQGSADLSKMSENIFVSKFIHTTRIIVNEEGTTAAAITSAVLANKATPPKFYLNRPFLYLIMEKSTNSLLFAGQVTNPKV